MAKPSPSNPLGYFFTRQYDDRLRISNKLFRERMNVARNLYGKNLLAHYGCVNAIEFSNKGELLASGGDDRRVLIWNVEQAVHGTGTPAVMRAQHISNIFCLGFDSTNKKVFSAGNDDQVIVHDVSTGDPVDYFLHEQPVYGLSINPFNDNVFASACDDGRVLIYDIREPASTEPFCLVSSNSAFHAVMFNPVEPRILTTANSREGVGLFDIRRPRACVLHYGGRNASQSCMSVRFNQRGTHILALRRRLPPVLYAVPSPSHVCQFDHPGYYNSCTMKSCCFAGDDDQFVLSGSDDFNLYVWKVPEAESKGQWVDSAHMILRGHRSIVNQVRFNSTNCIVASSGVEKLIKFWSPFWIPESTGSLTDEIVAVSKQRKVFTHEEYIHLVLRSGQFMSHDYSHQSTKEDPRMMAFFDSLVQREIEGWSSEDTVTSELSARSISVTVHLPQGTLSTDSDSDHSVSRIPEDQPMPVYHVGNVGPSSVPENEAETTRKPEEAQNRISQLIAKKRAQLMRLARTRSQVEEDGDDAGSDSSDLDGRTRSWVAVAGSANTSDSEDGTALSGSGDTDDKSPNSQLHGGETSNGAKRGTTVTENSSSKMKRKWPGKLSFSDSSSEEADNWRPAQKKKKILKKTGLLRKKSKSSSNAFCSKESSCKKADSSQHVSDLDRSTESDDSTKEPVPRSNRPVCTGRPKSRASVRRDELRATRRLYSRTRLLVDTTDTSDVSENEIPNSNSVEALCTDGDTNNHNDYCNNNINTSVTKDSESSGEESDHVPCDTAVEKPTQQQATTPDSGIVTGPCSSTGSHDSHDATNGNHSECNGSHVCVNSSCQKNGWKVHKLLKNRLNNVRRNYRAKNSFGDSDSNPENP